MRDPKIMLRIVNLIYQIWRKNPDLRLCQLIENCAKMMKHPLTDEPYRENMYYVEDDELEKRLRKIYNV